MVKRTVNLIGMDILDEMMNPKDSSVVYTGKLIPVYTKDELVKKVRQRLLDVHSSDDGVVLNRLYMALVAIYWNKNILILELDLPNSNKFICIDMETCGGCRKKSLKNALKVERIKPYNGGNQYAEMHIDFNFDGKSYYNIVTFASAVALADELTNYSQNEHHCNYVDVTVNHIKPISFFEERIGIDDVELCSKEENTIHYIAFTKALVQGVIPLSLSYKNYPKCIALLNKGKSIQEILNAQGVNMCSCTTPSAVELLEIEGVRPEIIEFIQKKLDEK